MQGRIVEREQPAQLLGTVAEGDSAQVAGEQPGAESAEGERGEADEDDLRQGGRLRHGQGLQGHAHGDHGGDLAVGVGDRHDRAHRRAERAHILLGLGLPCAGFRGGPDVRLAQLIGVRVGVAGAVAVHDRHEIHLGGVDDGQREGLQPGGGIVLGHNLGDERVVGEGLGDGQHPFAGGLADVVQRRHVARHRQRGADDDDEDELDEEEAPRQGSASASPESLPAPPWRGREGRHYFLTLFFFFLLPAERRRARPIAASQVSLATAVPSSDGRMPSSLVIESMEK